MRAPPPVDYASASGRVWRTTLGLLAAAAVAVPLAWALPFLAERLDGLRPAPLLDLLGRPVVQAGLAAWVAAVAGTLSWLAGARRGERTLRWDGRQWVLARAGRPDQTGAATLMLDLGPWMLVRFVPHAAGACARTWLPLALAGDPARWAALRGALWNARGGEVRP